MAPTHEPASDQDPHVRLRRNLHRSPELSGDESGTAQRILDFLGPLNPARTWTGLGGNGLAFAFGKITAPADASPTVLLRAELDALPIQESGTLAYHSQNQGVSHKCGHDGHMAILTAVASQLAKTPPSRGRVILLFQPAEETGAGAAAVIADPRFAKLLPDYAFALHNLPGHAMGSVLVRDDTFCCASMGLTVEFVGRSAHAAQPETGTSPATALCKFIEASGTLPAELLANQIAFATVVGAELGSAAGSRAFGTAPCTARAMLTLRADTDHTLQAMRTHCEQVATQLAAAEGLQYRTYLQDVFPAAVSNSDCVNRIRNAVSNTTDLDRPLPWSEDFAHFLKLAPGALIGLGAGEKCAPLHDPEYDFPDKLIATGRDLFLAILADCGVL